MSKRRFFMSKTTKKIVRAGLIAGIYIVLSLITFPVASGAIQFRIAEALCVLPLLFVEAIPALFVGCMLSNLITGCMILDVFLGSTITLVASLCTFFVGKVLKKNWLMIVFGGIFPVLLNAFLLPIIWILAYGVIEYVYYLQVVFLLISQSISIYALGTPLFFAFKSKLTD